MKSNRRDFLRGVAGTAGATIGLSLFPASIRKALAISANRTHGDIRDVEHIVILMQENRSFDHYFGTLPGVRGFADRFPIPRPDAPNIHNKTIWYQSHPESTGPDVLAPFRLNTDEDFKYMRVTGTPHSWPDAQGAWNDGKMNEWPVHKQDHALGYFTESDMPFQWAMANAFTICDAYHCSFNGNTNPNRVFHWTGGNDPLKHDYGPVLYNQYDNVEFDPSGGYDWPTYCERLEKAGISWQIYQNMADNFTDNPVAGFRTFRASYNGWPGSNPALKEKGLTTRDLDKLKADVIEGKLPQVSWIVGTAEGSEHPGPSSPAQGADYTSQVLDALTANPDVWSKTVLIINFDENDGFFDHVPPPAAPSYVHWDEDPTKLELAGASTVDTTGEYHEFPATGVEDEAQLPYHKNYGPGPRVPLYVVSPWSKGGWVNSQVFDHTSVLRFLEARFGVIEENITPYRRAVCGDLTSCFNFADPDDSEFYSQLPPTAARAQRAHELPETSTPPTPELPELPEQAAGPRPSRALPYELHVHTACTGEAVKLTFENTGKATAVFHVYDRLHLGRIPRRYTVGPGKTLEDSWSTERGYDLWVLGPNGFHRHFTGAGDEKVEPRVGYDAANGGLQVELQNSGDAPANFLITANAYYESGAQTLNVASGATVSWTRSLCKSANWYDFTLCVDGLAGFTRRFAGRVETGSDGWSDPAQGGEAIGDQLVIE